MNHIFQVVEHAAAPTVGTSGSDLGGSTSRGGGGHEGRGRGRGSASRGGGGRIYDYTDAPSTLGGTSNCPHYFCSLCVTSRPLTFLVGRAAEDARNAHKRYPLYRKFWRVLNDLGVWRHDQYLARKALRTCVEDVREVMPTCVLNVRE